METKIIYSVEVITAEGWDGKGSPNIKHDSKMFDSLEEAETFMTNLIATYSTHPEKYKITTINFMNNCLDMRITEPPQEGHHSMTVYKTVESYIIKFKK